MVYHLHLCDEHRQIWSSLIFELPPSPTTLCPPEMSTLCLFRPLKGDELLLLHPLLRSISFLYTSLLVSFHQKCQKMYLYEDSEDDYIDMEVGTYINFFDQSQCSTHSPREFEFHMSANYLSKDSTTSPADELFYQGKLLPLHLPPRLEMVEKIFQSTSVGSYDYRNEASEDFFSTPLVTAINTPTSANTPFESCNISPSESFRKDLDQEQFLFDYVNAINAMEDAKRSIAKKTKHSLLGLKLKASKAFLKNLFSKSACSHVSSLDVTGTIGEKDIGYNGRHRRSISGTIKHRLTSKSTSSSSTSPASSSSSSSGDSAGFQEQNPPADL